MSGPIAGESRPSTADLVRLADRRLDGVTRERLEQSLSDIDRARLAAHRRQNEMLASLRVALADPDEPSFAPGLQADLKAALDASWRRRVRAGVAAAAGAALVLIGLVVGLGGPAQPAIGTHPADLTFDYGAPGGLARIAGGHPQDPLPWLERHLPAHDVLLAALEKDGLRLLEGAVVETSPAPAVRLVLADDARRKVVLFVGVAQGGETVTSAIAPEGQMALTWRLGDLVLSLVGDEDGPEVLEVMRQVSDGLRVASAAATRSEGPRLPMARPTGPGAVGPPARTSPSPS